MSNPLSCDVINTIVAAWVMFDVEKFVFQNLLALLANSHRPFPLPLVGFGDHIDHIDYLFF